MVPLSHTSLRDRIPFNSRTQFETKFSDGQLLYGYVTWRHKYQVVKPFASKHAFFLKFFQQ